MHRLTLNRFDYLDLPLPTVFRLNIILFPRPVFSFVVVVVFACNDPIYCLLLSCKISDVKTAEKLSMQLFMKTLFVQLQSLCSQFALLFLLSEMLSGVRSVSLVSL